MSVKATYFIVLFATLTACSSPQMQPMVAVGFRGAQLGSAPQSEMTPLEKWKPQIGVGTREISDAYAKTNEPKALGDLAIQDVTYEYIGQQLFRIEINLWTEKQKRCPKAAELVSALESQYGISMTWHQSDYLKPQLLAQWRGPQAWVTYMCIPWNTTNMVVIESPSLSQEVEARLKSVMTKNELNASEKIKKALQ